MTKLTQWYNNWNTALIRAAGPAQLGAGHSEDPIDTHKEHLCPLCGKGMSLHYIDHPSNPSKSSSMYCP